MVSRIFVLFLTFALAPAVLSAQTAARSSGAWSTSEARGLPRFTLEGAAGSTLGDGPVVSISGGVSPSPWVMLLAEGEVFHVPSQHRTFVTSDGYHGASVRRGFTTYVFGGEMRIGAPVGRRVTPYGAVGMGIGTWRSNVDQYSPRRDGGRIVTVHAGGGVRVALRRHLSLIADARWTLGVSYDSVIGYVPIKGGLAWDF
jgi:hypothetical protein